MNNLRFLLFSILLCLPSFVVCADDNPDQDLPKVDRVVFFYPDKGGNRPNSPMPEYVVECHYAPGYMGFVLPLGVEVLSIMIKHHNFIVWQGDVTAEEPYTAIPAYLSGEYDVECTTDMGDIFEGAIVL